MKKSIVIILILLIIVLAFLIPNSLDKGADFSGDKKEKVEEIVGNIKSSHFNSLQRSMMMNYNFQDVSWDNENKCYQANVTFYTLFNIRYAKVKANCDEMVTIK